MISPEFHVYNKALKCSSLDYNFAYCDQGDIGHCIIFTMVTIIYHELSGGLLPIMINVKAPI